MKIVLLDGHALNPGDLDDSALRELGDCTVYERCSQEEIPELARDAEIVLGNKIVLGEKEFSQLPKLKYVGVQATGYNLIDVKAAARRGIVVTNVPAYSTPSVAQLTFAHLLNLTFHLSDHATGVRAGEWTKSPDFTYWNFPLVELAGLTMGLVGFGSIAQQVARIALAMDMRVLACRRHGGNEGMAVEMVDLETIFCQSDVVSLHCPATQETEKLVSRKRLRQMKKTAFLINTARGVLVDEAALAEALNEGWIAGAGLDVLSTEPPRADNPLLRAKNCFCTPHFAWGTLAARKRCQEVVVENIRAFLAGKPQNVVSGF
ncbi:MAG: D-2-hydroxyacid dehydrogenase [Planctomycetia bacterium]|nr:D-2-hydroxyacid dehydrogenase [Planctomycetia bacterium]